MTFNPRHSGSPALVVVLSTQSWIPRRINCAGSANHVRSLSTRAIRMEFRLSCAPLQALFNLSGRPPRISTTTPSASQGDTHGFSLSTDVPRNWISGRSCAILRELRLASLRSTQNALRFRRSRQRPASSLARKFTKISFRFGISVLMRMCVCLCVSRDSSGS